MSELKNQTTEEIQDALLIFLMEEFFVEKEDIDLNKSLVDTGVIDSVGLIEISSFIENSYSIHVTETDMTRENFGSVVKIVNFIFKNIQ